MPRDDANPQAGAPSKWSFCCSWLATAPGSTTSGGNGEGAFGESLLQNRPAWWRFKGRVPTACSLDDLQSARARGALCLKSPTGSGGVSVAAGSAQHRAGALSHLPAGGQDSMQSSRRRHRRRRRTRRHVRIAHVVLRCTATTVMYSKPARLLYVRSTQEPSSPSECESPERARPRCCACRYYRTGRHAVVTFRAVGLRPLASMIDESLITQLPTHLSVCSACMQPCRIPAVAAPVYLALTPCSGSPRGNSDDHCVSPSSEPEGLVASRSASCR